MFGLFPVGGSPFLGGFPLSNAIVVKEAARFSEVVRASVLVQASDTLFLAHSQGRTGRALAAHSTELPIISAQYSGAIQQRYIGESLLFTTQQGGVPKRVVSQPESLILSSQILGQSRSTIAGADTLVLSASQTGHQDSNQALVQDTLIFDQSGSRAYSTIPYQEQIVFASLLRSSATMGTGAMEDLVVATTEQSRKSATAYTNEYIQTNDLETANLEAQNSVASTLVLLDSRYSAAYKVGQFLNFMILSEASGRRMLASTFQSEYLRFVDVPKISRASFTTTPPYLTRIEPIDNFIRQGFVQKVKQQFRCPAVPTTGIDKTRNLRVYLRNSVKYPYIFMNFSSSAYVSSYRDTILSRVGVPIIVNSDGNSYQAARLMPTEINVEMTYVDNSFAGIDEFVRTWVFARRNGSLAFNVDYGLTKVSVVAILDDTIPMPVRNDQVQLEGVYTVVVNAKLSGYLSEPELQTRGLVTQILYED